MTPLSSALKAKRRRMPISLTPLIDVVFILLVFFMLASSFEKTRSITLIPPKKGKIAAVLTEDKPLTVLVEGTDRYKVGDVSYGLERLNAHLDANRHKKILIKTGQGASLQDVVFLLDLTGSLSLPNVFLLPYKENTP